jgi:hypothetical protein
LRGSLRLCDSAILPNRPHRHRDLYRLWRAGAGAVASIEEPAVISKILAHVGEGQAPMPSLLVLRPEPRAPLGPER